MGKLIDMIDSMIQEFAEDIPTTLVQKLGDLRKEMTTKYSGDPDSIMDKVSEAASKIANDNNACLINIVLTPSESGTKSGVATCLQKIDVNDVIEMLMTIPKVMHSIASSLNKEIPGFKQKMTLRMMMEEMRVKKDPMKELHDLLSMGKFESDGSGRIKE